MKIEELFWQLIEEKADTKTVRKKIKEFVENNYDENGWLKYYSENAEKITKEKIVEILEEKFWDFYAELITSFD